MNYGSWGLKCLLFTCIGSRRAQQHEFAKISHQKKIFFYLQFMVCLLCTHSDTHCLIFKTETAKNMCIYQNAFARGHTCFYLSLTPIWEKQDGTKRRTFGCNIQGTFKILQCISCHNKWATLTTPWPLLRWRMEEWPPVWRVAVNILNKQLWIAVKAWSSNSGVGQVANKSSL